MNPIVERLWQLRQAGINALPGHDRFLEVSGYRRPSMQEVLRREPQPRESAVLALIHVLEGEPHLLFMRRPEYDGVHSGQIAFPGGRREPGDTALEHTARREFKEETGADASDIELIGAMSRVYIPPSNSLVTPFLAFTPALGALSPDPREVAELIHAPLDHVLRPEALREGRRYVSALGTHAITPYYDVLGHEVWGATAMMVAELRVLFGADL